MSDTQGAAARDARTPHPPATEADRKLDALVNARFDEAMARHPVFATFLGLTEHDDELGDGSRQAILDDAAAAHRFVADLDALDVAQLSPYWAVERELALFAANREIFDIEVHRVWDRRVSATDEIGDGVVSMNHCNIYLDLCHDIGYYPPPIESRDFAYDPQFLDSAFTVPAFHRA